MRPPGFRLRTLLVAVAVVGVVLSPPVLLARSHRFLALAVAHQRAGGGPFFHSFIDAKGLAYLDDLSRRASRLSPERRNWHRSLAQKYFRAASHPWLPVAPDPPPPD